jgi:hypothetical protein
LITELLVCSGHETAIRNNKLVFLPPGNEKVRVPIVPFVVVGNPGIGKRSLSYLFIRALMEMGVDVFVEPFNYLLICLDHLSLHPLESLGVFL